MEKAEVLERWTEYIKDLFEDDRRKEKPKITRNIEGPKILKAEVRRAINRMKNNKAPGTHEITVE